MNNTNKEIKDDVLQGLKDGVEEVKQFGLTSFDSTIYQLDDILYNIDLMLFYHNIQGSARYTMIKTREHLVSLIAKQNLDREIFSGLCDNLITDADDKLIRLMLGDKYGC